MFILDPHRLSAQSPNRPIAQSPNRPIAQSPNRLHSPLTPMPDLFSQPSDAPWTPSQLAKAARRVVEGAIGGLWVRGEISGLKVYQSGHWYFSLCDAQAQIRSVMWRANASKHKTPPPEGTTVFVFGTPTVWEERGEFRLTVTQLLVTDQVGQQQLALERVREALRKDGLLDPERKRPLPELPRRIAIVTSLDGAALRDVIIVTRKRWPAIEVKSTTVFEDGLSGFAAITVGQVLEIHAQFDGATSRYVATRIELEDNASEYRLRGRIASLDTTAKTFKIGDAVINYANVLAANLPNLADGQRIRVRLQTTQVNGQWVATAVRTGVRRVDDHADARLRGLVTAFTSPQQFEVQGIPVDASNASFEPNAAAVKLGALVEVRGRAAEGKIVASRVKVRNERDDDLQRVELHGVASALDSTAKTFMLRDVKVDYSRVVEWKDGQPADLANGKQLEVKGLWSEDRSVLNAVVIEFE